MLPWPPHLTALLVFSAAQSYVNTGANAILYEVRAGWRAGLRAGPRA